MPLTLLATMVVGPSWVRSEYAMAVEKRSTSKGSYLSPGSRGWIFTAS